MTPQPIPKLELEPIGAAPEIFFDIPDRHKQSLDRTLEITDMVGPNLEAYNLDEAAAIPLAPGIYFLGQDVESGRTHLSFAKFDLEPKVLSGKIDSAHAVLPGLLGIAYSSHGLYSEKHTGVAVKGFYSREITDRFQRVVNEVTISQIQKQQGEIAYDPIAVIIAPAESSKPGGDHENHDILLVTKLDESVKSLDNVAWQLGFNAANVGVVKSAASALGRFNRNVGQHGDAKIKNVAGRANGQTSMIDFETSMLIDINDSSAVMGMVHEDLGKFIESLKDEGFFDHEAYRAPEVLQSVGEAYLDNWDDADETIQDMVYNTAAEIIDRNSEAIYPYKVAA